MTNFDNNLSRTNGQLQIISEPGLNVGDIFVELLCSALLTLFIVSYDALLVLMLFTFSKIFDLLVKLALFNSHSCTVTLIGNFEKAP